ncbi:type II secretion system F family protein [Celerinatantimonas yamalensis]|uniref:Type II secretion system F family protein n=1 Tax=Celerinatantimonas yamalensis TaxID=559956 RepID=A0ABW9G1R5_9GAMM
MPFLLGLAAFILGGILLVTQFYHKRKKLDFFTSKDNEKIKTDLIDQSVIDLRALTKIALHRRILFYLMSITIPLGERVGIKVFFYYLVWLIIGGVLNYYFLSFDLLIVLACIFVTATFFGNYLLKHIAKKHFNDNFPDALNLLASAISAGESLMHAIIYVGEQMHNDVGLEFKRMGERLQIGESPHVVLAKTCIRMPYPEFVFFSITLRANIERGGQLRDIIQQLNRVMFDARALDKKKSAMTAEARMSAKIVFVIPFGFLVLMKFLSPENFNYVLTDPTGRYLLYYVIASEFVGMLIISALMKGIK